MHATVPLIDMSRDLSQGVLRKRVVRQRIYVFVLLSDIFSIITGVFLTAILRPSANIQVFEICAIIIPTFLIVNRTGYSVRILREQYWSIANALISLSFAIVTLLLLAFWFKISSSISRTGIAGGFTLCGLLLSTSRIIVVGWGRRILKGDPLSCVIIIDGVDIVVPPTVRGVVASNINVANPADQPFILDWLAREVNDEDHVYVACKPADRPAWSMALKGSGVRGELLIPELDAIGVLGNHYFAGMATVPVSTGPLSIRDEIVKRAFDLALVVPLILFMLPSFIAVAAAVRLDSPGPVFFRQQRIGRGNRLFHVLKFRSMYHNQSDDSGALSTGRQDCRITRVGRFIRATSIDELPQLINILLGEMSFVGPRPHAIGSLAESQLFWEIDQRYWHRHACKPGLTGLAQIRGFRGATHRREDLVNRLQADLEYLANWSVWRDLVILLATVKVVVHRNAF